MKLVKLLNFDAAHYLEDYDGKCANLHGHTWRVKIEINYSISDSCKYKQNNGIFVDFTILRNLIMNRFDHKNLNDVIKINPTAENLSAIICLDLLLYLHSILKQDYLYIIKVKLYESNLSYIVMDSGEALLWLNFPVPIFYSQERYILELTKFMAEKIWK